MRCRVPTTRWTTASRSSRRRGSRSIRPRRSSAPLSGSVTSASVPSLLWSSLTDAWSGSIISVSLARTGTIVGIEAWAHEHRHRPRDLLGVLDQLRPLDRRSRSSASRTRGNSSGGSPDSSNGCQR